MKILSMIIWATVAWVIIFLGLNVYAGAPLAAASITASIGAVLTLALVSFSGRR